jgi:hypothetical protein
MNPGLPEYEAGVISTLAAKQQQAVFKVNYTL